MNALKWLNTIAFLAMIVINALANLLPLGGNTTGQVSSAYPNLFTPAAYTFAIWGIIYLFMAAFILYQWDLFKNKDASSVIRETIGIWFFLSCLMNIGWIFSWHFKALGLSLIFILGLLLTLILLERRTASITGLPFSGKFILAGFDIYYGWIIAATIANVSVFLVSIQWNRFGLSEQFWMILIVIVGALIGCLVSVISSKWIAGLSIIWAYSGILVRHFSEVKGGISHPLVIISLCLGIFLILASFLWPKAKQKVVPPKEPTPIVKAPEDPMKGHYYK